MSKKTHTTHKGLLAIVWIAMMLYGTINVLLAFFMKGIVDSTTDKNMDLFLWSAAATLLLVAFEFLMGNASRYLLQLYCKRNLLSQKICRYRNALCANAPDRTDLSAFSTDIELLYSNYYVNVALMACYMSQLVLSAVGIIYLNWKIAVIVLITTILPFVIPMLFSKKLQASTENYKQSADSYLSFVQDSLSGMQEIRTYRAFYTGRFTVCISARYLFFLCQYTVLCGHSCLLRISDAERTDNHWCIDRSDPADEYGNRSSRADFRCSRSDSGDKKISAQCS